MRLETAQTTGRWLDKTTSLQNQRMVVQKGRMQPSVVTYALDRLADLGIGHVFGEPGDYSFPINDAVEEHSRLSWVPSANELNAAYAADGYARRPRGCREVCTTYGVGELSALNGLMGAMAERLPVFHLVGTPRHRGLFVQGLICHHTPQEIVPMHRFGATLRLRRLRQREAHPRQCRRSKWKT